MVKLLTNIIVNLRAAGPSPFPDPSWQPPTVRAVHPRVHCRQASRFQTEIRDVALPRVGGPFGAPWGIGPPGRFFGFGVSSA
jgi:hypothetical protein